MAADDAPRTGYAIHSLQIDCLKNLKDLDEISFEDKPITGIFGPNCCGKSTILHALACCYQPPPGSSNHAYVFREFFLPNTDALWDGSRITLTHSFRFGSVDIKEQETVYEKKTLQWAPRRYKRPARHVAYVGIGTCVPEIERLGSSKKVNYTTSVRDDEIARQLIKALARILNRDYEELCEHLSGNRKYRGLKSSGIRYSALSMGAGEQRLLYLLEEVFTSPRQGLLLVDELDLLLHGEALERFVNVVHERAEKMKLQLVFTSHRERLLEFRELINVRHIHNADGKTCCLNETSPDALHRLTGKRLRPLEILVEDDLAAAVVSKVAGQLGMKHHVEITRFGAAINAFTVLAGMILKGDDVTNSLCVLDGDVYRTTTEKEDRARHVVCGDSDEAEGQRTQLLGAICDLNLPEGQQPEQYLHGLLIGLDDSELGEEEKELLALAKEIHVPEDSHDYLGSIIEGLGYARSEGFRAIVDLVAKSPEWDSYVKPVKEWLESKKAVVLEQTPKTAPVGAAT